MEIEALYTNSSKVRLPYSRISELPTSDLLIIVASTAWGDRKNLVFRLYSHDFYAIALTKTAIFWDQWDEGADRLAGRQLDNLLGDNIYFPRPSIFPPDATVYQFTGGYIPPADWSAIHKIMNDSMF